MRFVLNPDNRHSRISFTNVVIKSVGHLKTKFLISSFGFDLLCYSVFILVVLNSADIQSQISQFKVDIQPKGHFKTNILNSSFYFVFSISSSPFYDCRFESFQAAAVVERNCPLKSHFSTRLAN